MPCDVATRLADPEAKTLATIGVLGGMGPSATVDFLGKLVAATPAARDQDHVPVLVRNVPQIPDRSAAILAGSDTPLPPMRAGLDALEAAGADILAIPCNTAHHWYDALARGRETPILHIVDAVRRRLPDVGRIGLMATRGTLLAGVYEQRLGGQAARLLRPDEAGQTLVDEAIAAVKAGRSGASAAVAVVDHLLARGCASVILACTELPVALAGERVAAACIDATEALAQDCVAAAFGNLELRR